MEGKEAREGKEELKERKAKDRNQISSGRLTTTNDANAFSAVVVFFLLFVLFLAPVLQRKRPFPDSLIGKDGWKMQTFCNNNNYNHP